jgi:hypothetical protein
MGCRRHDSFQNQQLQQQLPHHSSHPVLQHECDCLDGKRAYIVHQRCCCCCCCFTFAANAVAPRYTPSLLLLLPLSSISSTMRRHAAATGATAILLPPPSPTGTGRWRIFVFKIPLLAHTNPLFSVSCLRLVTIRSCSLSSCAVVPHSAHPPQPRVICGVPLHCVLLLLPRRQSSPETGFLARWSAGLGRGFIHGMLPRSYQHFDSSHAIHRSRRQQQPRALVPRSGRRCRRYAGFVAGNSLSQRLDPKRGISASPG